jgi:hypothetical protein
MILHTIVSAAQIFAPLNTLLPTAGGDRTSQSIPFAGGYLEGTQGPDGLTVERLISTDPTMYLDSRYAPGSRIRLT